ncbi:MAG: RimK family alpha-L-glutamate ligase [Lachnospiraceae bacterium]|nr:RimK family alpha-L-glutamate ligase [Lachnospiraceae bacterium]
MHGWLVVNEFVNTPKFKDLFGMLEDAAARQGDTLELLQNGQLWGMLGGIEYKSDALTGDTLTTEEEKMQGIRSGSVSNTGFCVEKPDYVLFWDKDIHLAEMLGEMGLPVFNSAAAIAVCDDKAETFIHLARHGVRMPKTFIAPKKFPDDGLVSETFLEQVRENLGFPCVVKECSGSFGYQVYLAENENKLREIILRLGSIPYLVQEYIGSSYGRDIRIEVVGGEVIAAMKRKNPADFRANITNGGTMEAYTPTKAQSEMALEVSRLLGLDFAGVDILFGENDEPILCEVNSNAHIRNLLTCTGINAAEAILAHIHHKVKRRAAILRV